MGKQVCAKHDEAYETECRWCEPTHPMEAPVMRVMGMNGQLCQLSALYKAVDGLPAYSGIDNLVRQGESK